MSIIANLILALLSIAAMATAGVYTILAAMKIKDADHYSDNDDYQDAHKYLSWASVVTWVSLAILLVLMIFYFVFLSETVEFTGKWVVLLLVFVLVAMLTFSGIMSSMAAQKIKASSDYGDDDDSEKAFKDSIISSALSLGTVVLLIIFVILFFVVKAHKSKV